MFKQLSLNTLSLLLGAFFIFSAYTKIYPIEPFELTFVELGIGNWRTAPFIARFLIGLEFFIGLFLMLSLYVKTINKICLALLVVFNIYLLGILFSHGNTGNCGCFGTYLVMTPLQGIIKNLVLIVFSFVLLKHHVGFKLIKYNTLIIISGILLAFSMPHILNYVDLSYTQAYLNKPKNHFKLELDTLFKNAKINTPPAQLSHGKQILAFMSTSCPHCRIAAKKMNLLKKRNPNIPIYFILNDGNEKLTDFYTDTQSQNIPFCLLKGRSFVYLAGTQMPCIYLINNSVVELDLNYLELDQTEIENWLNAK